MQRIIIGSQSNSRWRGSQLEQSFDQRGGLPEAGKGDIVVTRYPIDPDYIKYWESLGFEIPTLVDLAGARTLDPKHLKTLSELLLDDPSAQSQVKESMNGDVARLEFFWIGEPEERLISSLGIPAYCSTSFSRDYTSKARFHRLAHGLNLPLIDGTICRTEQDVYSFALPRLEAGQRVLLKGETGTAGIAGGAMIKLDKPEDLLELSQYMHQLGDEFVAEMLAEGSITEVGVHWEITQSGETEFVGIAQQVSANYGYQGAHWPPEIPDTFHKKLVREVREKLGPMIAHLGGVGFFCCDVMVQPREHWMDFNPRKGAIRYILQTVKRLKGSFVPFWHEHVNIKGRNVVQEGRPKTFADIQERIGDLLDPNKETFVVITNPGVIRHNYVDITGISGDKESAHKICDEAARRLAHL